MKKSKAWFNSLSGEIIDASIEVHRELGPGLLESVYEHCLEFELVTRGFQVKRQFPIPVVYKGERLNKDFFIDLLVENEIIIELKCVEKMIPVHEVQLLTYLPLADKKLGLLLNFNVNLMREGIKRKINGDL
ncbi:MAG: GxxExxY protein [Bacteroidota bacterium]